MKKDFIIIKTFLILDRKCNFFIATRVKKTETPTIIPKRASFLPGPPGKLGGGGDEIWQDNVELRSIGFSSNWN